MADDIGLAACEWWCSHSLGSDEDDRKRDVGNVPVLVNTSRSSTSPTPPDLMRGLLVLRTRLHVWECGQSMKSGKGERGGPEKQRCRT